MVKVATQGRFDMDLVGSVGRLGRSLKNLVELLNELQLRRKYLSFLNLGMDISTTCGRMMFSIFVALSELERNPIRERVITAQNRAKTKYDKICSPS